MLNKNRLPISELAINKNIKEKLEDVFDVSFSVSEIQIDSMDSFLKRLDKPFRENENIYYRGERINTASRRLIPTYLRNDKPCFSDRTEKLINLNSRTLYDFYMGNKQFSTVYSTLYGEASVDKMYNMTAFAQHYLDISPFIDFSKSLYVAVSFALKGREKAQDNFVIYTAYDIGDDDTTSDINEVNLWLENYNVNIVNTAKVEEINKFLTDRQLRKLPDIRNLQTGIKKLEDIFNGVSPTAKLIDIPTNDLMKYQQGVFLLLNDFSLVDSQYLTKTIRQSFVINKYVIDKNLCGELREYIIKNAPQYRYECLMDISRAVKG